MIISFSFSTATAQLDTSTNSSAQQKRTLLHTSAYKSHQILLELSKCNYYQLHESRLVKLQQQQEKKGLPSKSLIATRPVTVIGYQRDVIDEPARPAVH